jgi:hypothetical protein
MNYENLTLEELENIRLEKMADVDTARAALAEVSVVYDRKARAVELERKLGGLTNEDLEILQGMMPAAQSTAVTGIESEEKIGNPGS